MGLEYRIRRDGLIQRWPYTVYYNSGSEKHKTWVAIAGAVTKAQARKLLAVYQGVA